MDSSSDLRDDVDEPDHTIRDLEEAEASCVEDDDDDGHCGIRA